MNAKAMPASSLIPGLCIFSISQASSIDLCHTRVDTCAQQENVSSRGASDNVAATPVDKLYWKRTLLQDFTPPTTRSRLSFQQPRHRDESREHPEKQDFRRNLPSDIGCRPTAASDYWEIDAVLFIESKPYSVNIGLRV